MTGSVWLIVSSDVALGALPEVARGLGVPVAAAVVGTRALADKAATRVDRVDWFATAPDLPNEAWASAVAEHLAAEDATLVLTGNGAASRVIVGAVAARLRAPVFAPVQEVTVTPHPVRVTRLVYGGIAQETDGIDGPVCLVLEAGPAGAVPAGHDPVAVRRIAASPLAITCSVEDAPPPVSRDLGSAVRVIGVGRGLKDAGYLVEVERLAGALGAEIACSRPVAEDLGWLPHDRYLGVSGRRIAPQLYLMLGISGELQHMIGVRDADLIVAVNIDPRAPVVACSDIAVIGDLRAIVPALIRQLEPTR